MELIEQRATELKAKIRSLCDEFPVFGMMLVFEDDNREYIEIAGNLCPLCASNNLLKIILIKGLKHHEDSSSDKVH